MSNAGNLGLDFLFMVPVIGHLPDLVTGDKMFHYFKSHMYFSNSLLKGEDYKSYLKCGVLSMFSSTESP